MRQQQFCGTVTSPDSQSRRVLVRLAKSRASQPTSKAAGFAVAGPPTRLCSHPCGRAARRGVSRRFAIVGWGRWYAFGNGRRYDQWRSPFVGQSRPAPFPVCVLGEKIALVCSATSNPPGSRVTAHDRLAWRTPRRNAGHRDDAYRLERRWIASRPACLGYIDLSPRVADPANKACRRADSSPNGRPHRQPSPLPVGPARFHALLNWLILPWAGSPAC